MLKRVITTSEPVRLLLLADPAVWQAQVIAARAEVDAELGGSESVDFVDEIIRVVRATSGDHSEVVRTLSTLSDGARRMLGTIISDEQHETAQSRLKEALQSEDTREGLAYLRAHGAAALYRESSNTQDLLDSCPSDASWITIRGLSREEIKAAEKTAGPRPRLGGLVNAQALDVARKAARNAEDSTLAYAEHMAALDSEKQMAVEDYELWVESVDREVFRRSVCIVDGFDLERGPDGYPVEAFIDQCAEAVEVITEAARHARQVSRLGKSKPS